MNKPALVEALIKRTRAPKQIAEEFVDALFDTITEQLAKGEKVSFGNFGTFYLVRHKDRVTAHPTTKEQLVLPPLTLVKFRPSTKVKENINRN
jgi:DNA-binding protein HU-beta